MHQLRPVARGRNMRPGVLQLEPVFLIRAAARDAFRIALAVNWCPKEDISLSNEQVVGAKMQLPVIKRRPPFILVRTNIAASLIAAGDGFFAFYGVSPGPKG